MRAYGSSFVLSSIVLTSLLSLTGCSYFFGSRATTNEIAISQGTEQCLSSFKPNLKSWAHTGEPAIGPQVDCVVRGIDQFTKRTVGPSGDGWSKGELVRFFDKYFAAQSGESAAGWIEEILRLKQSWFGGYSDRLTRTELLQIRTLLLSMRPDLEALSPSMSALMFSASTADLQQLESSAIHLDSIANLIGDEVRQIKGHPPAYEITSLLNLGLSLGVIQKQNDADSEKRRVRIETSKSILSGGSGRFVTSQEWSRLMKSAARALGVAARAKYLSTPDKDWMLGDFAHTQAAVHDGLRLLDDSIAAQGQRTDGISIASILTLVDGAADENGMLGKKIHSATIDRLLPLLIGKALYGNGLPDLETHERIFGAAQAKTLRAGLNDWMAGQSEIVRLNSASDAFGPRDLVALFTSDVPQSETAVHKSAREQMAEIFAQGRPAVRDDKGRTWIAPVSELPALSPKGVSLVNGLRSGLSVLFRGYSHSAKKNDGTLVKPPVRLTSDEIVEIYFDIRPLGLDLNIVDARTTSAARRTFLEGSIFTSVSRGGDTVGVREMLEWFQIALGASSNGDQMYKGFIDRCGLDRLDVFGQKKLNEICFREKFWNSFLTDLPNIPNLVEWYKKTSDENQTSFRRALEDASRTVGSDHFDATTSTVLAAGDRLQPVDSSDVRAMLPILHYTESLILNYDQNSDGVLDENELKAALPTFRGLIKQIGGGSADSEYWQDAIFWYLIAKGVAPTKTIGGKASLLGFIASEKFYTFKADRLKVLEIIASFNSTARQAKQDAVVEYVKSQGRNVRAALTAGSSSSVVTNLTQLFGCPDEKAFGELLHARAKALSDRDWDAETFITRVKNAIQDDPSFDLKCASF